MSELEQESSTFEFLEASVKDLHTAFKSGELTSRELVERYLERIEAFDRNGPKINSIISINPYAFEEADRADQAMKGSGPALPLHGVPVILKDQIDAVGTPTTLGSVVFKNYFPDRDAFVVERLRDAGAVILAKATLGEMGGGDTHGSLFGSTQNPYDLNRTVGGSSGGPAAAVSCNFGAIGVGQEAYASIRRPAGWNCIVGMRPTAGLVSRSGVYSGWPGQNASLGPMTRSVEDLARLLDVMVGYDTEDPMTALGVGHAPETYSAFLDTNGLRGARIGILREVMGDWSEPESEDFKQVNNVFEKAVGELSACGATVVDPIIVPRLTELLAKRGGGGGVGPDNAWDVYFNRSKAPPFRNRDEMMSSVEYGRVYRRQRNLNRQSRPSTNPHEAVQAREELMFNILKVMADNRLDAIVHKTVEHQPTLIRECVDDSVDPPFVKMDTKGAPGLNTFLIYASSIAVPAGFTAQGLPASITFFGRPYAEPTLIKLAFAYEQATHHRRPPSSTPA
jgi:Asp-tRNA(Asn)/Glu-tRNA(Gln) amidotransferase A subunit family amidase